MGNEKSRSRGPVNSLLGFSKFDGVSTQYLVPAFRFEDPNTAPTIINEVMKNAVIFNLRLVVITNWPKNSIPTRSLSAPAQEELGSNPIAIDRTARSKSKPAPKVCKDICDSGCDMAFNNEKMRGYHIYEVHKIKAYKCPYAGCNHETSRYDNAQAHRAKNCKSEAVIKKRLSALTTTKKTSKKRPRCSIKDLNPGVPIQRPQSSEIPPSPDKSANINATARADSQPAFRNGGAGLVDIGRFLRLRNGGSLAVDDPKAPSLPDSLVTDELGLKDALERFERKNANLKREVAHLKRQNDTYSFFFRRVFAPYHESRDCECNH
ncbi:hypothetical protein TWF703_002127 [Orbilia oligospora]|uniref:Uncharacterized protein n=1 Tax=Orbilia oligospora TaxID=2813651 RepID=A0A7C8JUV8_ORBOL|nr:hypothetical protein TWF703_002127 [Orbilia oligospora]